MLDLIMCIDDDPITLMLIKKVVHKASFSKEIINAQNGEEALSILDELNNVKNNQAIAKPQLIFLDLNMPVMGGWEFLDFFSKSNYFDLKNIKVIVLTSTIDPDDIKKSKAYPNVIDFQSKPITVEMLNHIKTKL
ncbi:response regulator [Flavobacterium sp. N3904]|uniref:response regulator n=1 Tax=Flavobacterium sp. N3904 TaxID=2986835 RepID=UPI002224ACE2|nr:response regulator [Flavobacterium sp. N3904]